MAMACIMFIMLVIGIVYYRRAQFEAELTAMNWLIKWEEVSMNEKKDSRKSKKVCELYASKIFNWILERLNLLEMFCKEKRSQQHDRLLWPREGGQRVAHLG